MACNSSLRRLLPALLLAIAGFFSLAATFCRADEADKAYAIRLSAPFRVGDKFEVVTSATQRARYDILSAGKSTLSDQTVTAKLEGTMEVLAVDSHGTAFKLACTVRKFVRTDGKEPAEVMPAGGVFIAESSRKEGETGFSTHFSLKEGELSADQLAVLSAMLNLQPPESPTDDETAGSAAPQKIGATWAINPAKMVESFAKSDIVIAPADLTGSCTLTGTQTSGEHKYLEVKISVAAKKMTPTGIKGLKPENASIDVKLTRLIPSDGTSQSGAQIADYQMMMKAKVAGPDGNDADVSSITTLHREFEFHRLP